MGSFLKTFSASGWLQRSLFSRGAFFNIIQFSRSAPCCFPKVAGACNRLPPVVPLFLVGVSAWSRPYIVRLGLRHMVILQRADLVSMPLFYAAISFFVDAGRRHGFAHESHCMKALR